MTSPINLGTRTYVRRLVAAVLLAGAATLGGSVFGGCAIACAEPNTGSGEWDVGKYDNCIAGLKENWENAPMNDDTRAHLIEGMRRFCTGSGGDCNAAQQKCQAPARTGATFMGAARDRHPVRDTRPPPGPEARTDYHYFGLTHLDPGTA
jgi:hypothetical protein